MATKVAVRLTSCDGDNFFFVDATKSQYAWLVSMASVSESQSYYSCIPYMEVSSDPKSDVYLWTEREVKEREEDGT